jgi:AmmeMemoRadiSam system protein B
MEQNTERPLIRRIEAVPVKVKGQDMILLKDPEELVKRMIMVPPNVFFIVSRFDGKHTLTDIQVEYNRKFGHLIFSDQIKEVMTELDTVLLLENDNYFKYVEFLHAEFKKQNHRECTLAGAGFPDDARELKAWIDTFFEGVKDSGVSSDVAGIISPHIDFERGGAVYGKAYNELKKSDADLFVIFGTSHHDTENYFVLSKKTFKTPLGDVPANKTFIDKLASNCRTDFFQDEYLHKAEHSIEFQAVMLRYMFPGRKITIVPIIVGAFDNFDGSPNIHPKGNPLVNEFINAFRKTVISGEYKPVFIAGADFAHVGLAFGDRVKPGFAKMKTLEEDELKSIEFIQKLDADSFYSDVIKDQEKRRVCGLSPIYAMMKCMDADSAKLIEYKQCKDPQGLANVTIAAMGFYR